MPITKRIVCLANSRKHGGRCIAGREYTAGTVGAWLRPVSDRPREEVPDDDCRYDDGSDISMLDIVDVPLRAYTPKEYQQENWLLEPAGIWIKSGTLARMELGHFTGTPGRLWVNGHHSTNGMNDRVPVSKIIGIQHSLELIRVDAFMLSVYIPGEQSGNLSRHVRAKFRFADEDYQLRVTDPRIETAYTLRGVGEFSLGASYLTISLGERYEGYCYKLVAAVISEG